MQKIDEKCWEVFYRDSVCIEINVVNNNIVSKWFNVLDTAIYIYTYTHIECVLDCCYLSVPCIICIIKVAMSMHGGVIKGAGSYKCLDCLTSYK